MSIRISSSTMYDRGMKDIFSTQTDLSNLQNKITSGTDKATFIELGQGGDIENYTSMQFKYNQSMDYNSNNQMVVDRLSAMDSALSSITDLASTTMSNLVLRRSPNGKSFNVSQLCSAYLGIVSDMLNTQYEGRYLFSGSRTNVAPIADVTTISNIINDQPTSNYYRGNSQILTIQASPSLNLNYGITGDNPTFQKLIGAFNYIIKGDQANDDKTLATAVNVLKDAMNGIANLRANIGNNMRIIKTLIDINDNNNMNLLSSIGEIIDTDIPKTTAAIINKQTILQASYKVTSIISGLSLKDYL